MQKKKKKSEKNHLSLSATGMTRHPARLPPEVMRLWAFYILFCANPTSHSCVPR